MPMLNRIKPKIEKLIYCIQDPVFKLSLFHICNQFCPVLNSPRYSCVLRQIIQDIGILSSLKFLRWQRRVKKVKVKLWQIFPCVRYSNEYHKPKTLILLHWVSASSPDTYLLWPDNNHILLWSSQFYLGIVINF